MAPLKKKKQKGPAETGIDMTPMIDIVFQLLIFFIVATQVKRPEGLLTAYLPTDSGTVGPPPKVESPPLTIRLENIKNRNASGASFVANGNETVSVYYSGFDRLGIGNAGLSALHKRLTEIPVPSRAAQQIIIDPQEKSALWDVIQVLNICRLSEFKKVTFKNKALGLPGDR